MINVLLLLIFVLFIGVVLDVYFNINDYKILYYEIKNKIKSIYRK